MDDVAVQMKELLDSVNKNIERSVKSNIDRTSKESVQKLKNTSPRLTGDYAKGWGTKRVNDKDVIVHNRTEYQLTHLLENGHVIRNKYGTYGRTNGDGHISDVEKWAIDELPRRIMEDIE